jgi:hypothetical protein
MLEFVIEIHFLRNCIVPKKNPRLNRSRRGIKNASLILLSSSGLGESYEEEGRGQLFEKQ